MSEAVSRARETMDRLYSPGGCPWDAEQTHASLVPYLIEESHELVEAIEAGSRDDVVEELGDVLLQVLFHARLGEDEADPYDLDEVAETLVAKLRRRHPHVFEDRALASDLEALTRRWDEVKGEEKPHRTSVLDGIPPSLPALARAQKVLRKAARIGVARPPAHGEDAASAWADEVLALVDRAEDAGIDAESALRSRLRSTEDAVRVREASQRRESSAAPQDQPQQLPDDPTREVPRP